MQRYAARLGRPLKPRGTAPDLAKRARVLELRATGMTLKEIGEVTGVTGASVGEMLRAIAKARGKASPVSALDVRPPRP